MFSGKRIAITRAVARAEAWASELRAHGVDTLICPTIAYAPPSNDASLVAALHAISHYDWLVLTSAAAVDTLAARQAFPLPARLQVAAVGQATAAALAGYGVRVDLLPAAQSAAGLLAESDALAGCRVLLPVADIAREALAAGLRARGAAVDVVTAYRTIPGPGAADLLEPLRARALDAIIFSSPSTLQYLLDGLAQLGIDRPAAHALLAPVALVAIGPTTARALEAAGLPVAAQAPTPSVDGIIAALAAIVHQ